MKLFKQNNKHFTMWYNLSKQWDPGKIWKVDLGGTRLVWSLEPVAGKLQKPLSGGSGASHFQLRLNECL